MQSFPIDPLLIESVSWTLLHFVWQACVIAGVAAIGFAIAVRSPNTCYRWGIFCLACLGSCPVFTFCWLHPSTYIGDVILPVEAVGVSLLPVEPISNPVRCATEPSDPDRTSSASHWELAHMMIVGVWLMGQMFVGGRLMLAGYFVHRLRQTVVPVPQDLRKAGERLAMQLGLRCPQIAAAENVCGAIAAGLFRQMIVVPTAWIAEMTPDMLEAVIAHELAHLRRHDLWINLVQRFIESAFFFHPAVWWLSGRIRHEREICCDLLAIRLTKQRRKYAETLEHVAQV